jgi:hypothetical protein
MATPLQTAAGHRIDGATDYGDGEEQKSLRQSHAA